MLHTTSQFLGPKIMMPDGVAGHDSGPGRPAQGQSEGPWAQGPGCSKVQASSSVTGWTSDIWHCQTGTGMFRTSDASENASASFFTVFRSDGHRLRLGSIRTQSSQVQPVYHRDVTQGHWVPRTSKTLSLAPLWCDLGHCSRTVYVIRLLRTSALNVNQWLSKGFDPGFQRRLYNDAKHKKLSQKAQPFLSVTPGPASESRA